MAEQRLKPNLLIRTDVVVNTKNVEELEKLMIICESSSVDIKWLGGASPTQGAYASERISQYGEDTCINLNDGKYFSWGSKNVYKNVLSFQQFCKINEGLN